MAPDVNSIPSSPRHSMNSDLQGNSYSPSQPHSRSRRTSTNMPPPSTTSHQTDQFPGMPVRHSRPFTPAELHLELEKEQEAVVNRLTRELSALRAHSASVASNASSTSATDPNVSHETLSHPQSTSPAIPNQSVPHTPTTRQHRSSSSLSNRTRSLTSSSSSFAVPPSTGAVAPPPSAAPLGSTSQASVDRARDAAGMPPPTLPSATPITRSRQSSTSLPQHPHPLAASPSQSYLQPAALRSAGPSPEPFTSAPTASRPPSSAPAITTRLEEAAHARSALEKAKAENEDLAKKVKELEGVMRELRVERGGGAGGSEDRRGRSGAPESRTTT